MAYEKDARTAFASKALELSEMFMIKFGQRSLPGLIPRVVKVEPPEESTGGGKRAREPISLVPLGQGAAATLVVGWMNVAENRAELRAYYVLAEMHRQRYGNNLDLPKRDYEQFVEDARQFFAQEGIRVDIVTEAPPPPEERPSAVERQGRPARQGSGGMGPALVLFLSLAMVAIGLGVGWYLFAPK